MTTAILAALLLLFQHVFGVATLKWLYEFVKVIEFIFILLILGIFRRISQNFTQTVQEKI